MRTFLHACIFTAACIFNVHAQAVIPVESIDGPTCVVLDTVTGTALPLSPEVSKYNVLVTDGLAHIKLTQLFVNRFENVNDIVYVFPLPHNGSVHAMAMEYDGKLYRAEIYEKEEAQQIYDSIKDEGGNAALLLQQKPNIFQQRLANIRTGDTAYVQIEVSMPLSYNDGVFELAIPTMVAERFGGEQGMPHPGQNPWNPPADRDGHTLLITALIQTGYPALNVSSPTHPILAKTVDEARPILLQQGLIDEGSRMDMQYNTAVYLKDEVTYPNKDYVLRFGRETADQDFSLSSFYDPSRNEGYFALQLYPCNRIFASEERPNLELIFLIDRSGSQSGWPILKEKAIVRDIMSRLGPSDFISLCSFSTEIQWAFGNHAVVAATADNVAGADKFLDGIVAGGGTYLLDAVRDVLAVPKNSDCERYFIFLTDGFVGNEEAILQEIANHPSKPTIFTFGAGDNLNRYLLDEAAKVGNGFSTPITQDESVSERVDEAWTKLESPQLKNITIDFGGLQTSDLVMPRSTSLYRGSPIEVYGRYTSAGSFPINVRGVREGQPIEISRRITLAGASNTNIMVPKIWAKQLIDRLSIEEGTSQTNKDAIVEISTAYQVLSNYTAFLAINPVEVNEGESSSDEFSTSALSSVQDRLRDFTIRADRQFVTITIPDGEMLEAFEVYDLQGRLLFRMDISSYRFTKLLRWDGRLESGMRLMPGRYIIRLKAGNRTISRMFTWR